MCVPLFSLFIVRLCIVRILHIDYNLKYERRHHIHTINDAILPSIDCPYSCFSVLNFFIPIENPHIPIFAFYLKKNLVWAVKLYINKKTKMCNQNSDKGKQKIFIYAAHPVTWISTTNTSSTCMYILTKDSTTTHKWQSKKKIRFLCVCSVPVLCLFNDINVSEM